MIKNPVRISDQNKTDSAALRDTIARFQQPITWRSMVQITNTFLPYAALWYLMYLSLAISWWLTVPLAILAGAFLIRLFIIFHDCGHASFFKSQKANDIVGFITGVLTLTPYQDWRWKHALHHARTGDLDRRGWGDVWTLTVQEYLESSPWKRSAYRIARNPILLFVIAPIFLFFVQYRFPGMKANKRERLSVFWTNLGILALAAVLSKIFGIRTYLILQSIVTLVAGSAGIWMFYVQHQFEGVYWERHGTWDYTTAALRGSSFYKLPKIFQWFSGNIGFHHIHHLSPRIPNYFLERCHMADSLLRNVQPITFFSSLKSLRYRLWDEERQELVGYRHVKVRRRELRQALAK